MNFKNKYRIVTDNFSGYEAQVKYWYFPFWIQIHKEVLITNTSGSICDSEKVIEYHKNKRKFKQEVVKTY